MNQISINFVLNGNQQHVAVYPNTTLMELLRLELGATGTKEGCNEGACGACTVLLDGKSVKSCLILAAQAEGRQITTIEGIGTKDELDPLQKAFLEQGAVQCGYCSPGMILSAKALLAENPHPTEEEIRKGIAGNVCRCTGYVKIIEAIMSVANGK